MTTPHRPAAAALALAGLLAAAPARPAPPACEARAEGAPPRVVELYTSEGCSSCPPADRWLSTLKDRSDVLAAAFHVDYWDRLGWRDRFASAEATRRQAGLQQRSGAGFSYTPQVVVDGRDWRAWPQLPAPAAASTTATLGLALVRHGAQVQVAVWPLGAATAGRVEAWWAWLEDGHESAVRSGENAGATLRHDHVVRRFDGRPAWDARQPASWSVEVPAAEAGSRPRRLLLVLGDAASGRTLQAAQLGC